MEGEKTLKRQWLGMVFILLLFVVSGCGMHPAVSGGGAAVQSMAPDGGSRVLVVYYSYSGHTRRAAERLALLTQGDLYEVQPAMGYTSQPTLAFLRSFGEVQLSSLPDLAGPLPDLSGYQLILVGGPVWKGKVARPLASWLALNDLSGKKVAPFWTYDGDDSGYAADFAAQVGPVPTDGLGLLLVENMEPAALETALENWLAEVRPARPLPLPAKPEKLNEAEDD